MMIVCFVLFFTLVEVTPSLAGFCWYRFVNMCWSAHVFAGVFQTVSLWWFPGDGFLIELSTSHTSKKDCNAADHHFECSACFQSCHYEFRGGRTNELLILLTCTAITNHQPLWISGSTRCTPTHFKISSESGQSSAGEMQSCFFRLFLVITCDKHE